MKKLLIANRGEIAIRIMHAAAGLGVRTVAVYSEDDSMALHIRKADESHMLEGRGVSAYLDQDRLLTIAHESGCEAIHPGYGFLSENAEFAEKVEKSGLIFVGPNAQTIELFGNKAAARRLAEEVGVPLLAGTKGVTSLEDANQFFASLAKGEAIMIKALAGGGGRGMRVVQNKEELAEKYEQCQSEAQMAFGRGDVYVETYMPRARHIEVQIIGDGTGAISHLWERECSIQRRNQKIVEVAPAPGLDPTIREKILNAAVTMAKAANYKNVGTFEFLVDAAAEAGSDPTITFMEANPRIQVEHTVTEEVTGLDIVRLQLEIARGNTLSDLKLTQADVPSPRGFAVQARINMETMTAAGDIKPAGGVLSAFDAPFGPGIRIDASGYVGYRTSPNFDSLLVKLIGHSPSSDYLDAVSRTYRALCEFRIEGVETNLGFLQSLLRHPDFKSNNIYTRFVEDHAAELLSDINHQKLFFDEASDGNQSGTSPSDGLATTAPAGSVPILAPMQGTIFSIDANVGDALNTKQGLIMMEAMKMQIVITPEQSGIITGLCVEVGDTVFEDDILGFIELVEGITETEEEDEKDLDRIRPDLEEVFERQSLTQDAARPKSVERRRKTGQRTARENLVDICDADTFKEYGSLVIAAQRSRRSVDDLIHNTPADGLITGIGQVNSNQFDEATAQCALLIYDYTVLAGTQGVMNHAKTDRILGIAKDKQRPVILFTEGGGGRPGDVDLTTIAGLYIPTFALLAGLSGLVPVVGINSGYCFAGNAAFLGCCDVIIATENSSIGMGGPAMIEGGGLGVFKPGEVGPVDVHTENGVIDIAVADEEEAVKVAKKYLSYFQGPLDKWECADQRELRHIIPENRLQIYDVRQVIETFADIGSVLEIRRHFGLGMVTAFARIEGKPLGIIANNPVHLAGAIECDGADKAARFMQLCDAFDIPLLFLCDTPGIMVGPQSEKTANIRHCSRLFVNGANLTVPIATVVLRKAYGLGAMAMAGGGFHQTQGSVSWPTGEFGGMGLEGAVQLGYRKELEAIEDLEARQVEFNRMVAESYERGKALNTATYFEIDDVIDPMTTRSWVSDVLLKAFNPPKRSGKKRPNVDTW